MKLIFILLLTLCSFFSGSIMYSYLLPKYFKNIDIREVSYDKNPGGTNTMDSCGPIWGIICIVLDIMKAFIPIFICINYFKITNSALVPIAVAPVFGHAFSPFLKFRGGKAVASTFGSFMALYQISSVVIILALILLFFKFIIVINPNSSKVTISLITLNIFTLFRVDNLNIKFIVILISIIVILKQNLHPDKDKMSVSLFNRYFKITIHS